MPNNVDGFMPKNFEKMTPVLIDWLEGQNSE